MNIVKFTKRILKDERGFINFAKMFGLGKKSPDLGPIMQAPVQKQLTEFPTGAALNERILAALKGQGLGFDPSFVERTTSPVAAQREARFKEQEMPFLTSEMSGRGLGRSTIAQEGVRRAVGAKERDINELIANAYYQNEIQKAADKARYEQAAQQFAMGESDISGKVAGEKVRREELGLGFEQARRAEDADLNARIWSGLLSLGASAVIPGGFQGAYDALKGMGAGGAGAGSSILSQAGGPLTYEGFQTSQLQQLLNMLQRGAFTK